MLQWIWSLPPRRVLLHGTNFLPESIRSNRAQLLLANHRLRSASNLQFSCRQLPLSNSEQRGASELLVAIARDGLCDAVIDAAKSLNRRIEKSFATVISVGSIVMQSSKPPGHVAPKLHRGNI